MKKLWIWLDPTKRCNLECKLCYTKASHSNDDLSLESFKLIVDKLESSSYQVELFHLNWRGEPLMNKEFLSILEYASSKLSYTYHWHTNGMLLNEKNCERICNIDNTLMKIYVSIDGGTKETHNKNRGSNTFEKSLIGLSTLLTHRNDNNYPFIGVYTIDLGVEKKNYDSKLKSLLEKVDEHIITNPIYPDLDSYLQMKEVENPLKIDLASSNFELHSLSQNIPNGPCFWAGNTLAIEPNGNVFVCIVTHDKKGMIGNIFHESLAEIVANSEKFRNEIINQGRVNIEHCSSCYKCETKTTANNVYSI